MIKKVFFAAMALLAGFGFAQAQNEEDEAAKIGRLIAAMPVHEGDPAPDFSLKDLEGNEVTLTYYQGDWVVLDFWGSWCRYCVAGIPDMKAAYAKYHDLGFEIIGIDCGESEEAWRAAVAKYELPWVNLYNPGPRNEGVCSLYGVKAYPTKIVVNPEGYIYSVYLGEDPEFYTFLSQIFSE